MLGLEDYNKTVGNYLLILSLLIMCRDCHPMVLIYLTISGIFNYYANSTRVEDERSCILLFILTSMAVGTLGIGLYYLSYYRGDIKFYAPFIYISLICCLSNYIRFNTPPVRISNGKKCEYCY